ncbi:dihydrodipicolinate reductase [Actinomadura rugatobispora]|uniref:Dihydrodipicolinate reductase n=1 Tax=Actinomadura rugatobispora TaxID=1994 RepID=A0ABW1A6E2_9ACTN|nr:diacylglycerol kinase [Actinomadura rugatobispora]
MLRVVQWATGPVGRHAIAAVVDHPDLELAGCLVYDPDKGGRDAGDIAGIGPVGITATTERSDILALDADCVLFMAQGDADPMGALDDICPLLASGKNVVSTAVTPLIYPASMGPEVVRRLEEACAEGGTTFHATGIEPGWASEVLPLAMSGLFRHVDSLIVQELLDYANYDNRFMLFDVMGFGHPADSTRFFGADPAVLASPFRAPLMMVAEALEATIEDFDFHRDIWLADEPFDVAAGRIESGTIAALRFGATAVIEGRRALTVEHVTRLHPDAAPGWPTGRGWKVTVEGRPSMVVEAKIGVNGEDENDQGCLGTAMHAVHAIVPVCAAPAGIRTFLDLPTITGRHSLRRPRTDPPRR